MKLQNVDDLLKVTTQLPSNRSLEPVIATWQICFYNYLVWC